LLNRFSRHTVAYLFGSATLAPTALLAILTCSLPSIAQTGMSFRSDGETIITPGLPFQAERVTRSYHKLTDGTEISREEHETIARDADGRFYDESKLTSSGDKPLPDAGTFHLIADPVAHTTLSWSTLSQVATSSRLSPSSHVTVSALPHGRDETSFVSKNSTIVTTQDLGKKTIAGLPATGTRTITIILQGAIGNNRDIVVTHDAWVSTDLQITISEKDDNPVSGTRTSEITTINRTAPEPALFQLPPGYTLRNQSLGGGVVSGLLTAPPPPSPPPSQH
jgi:hypothetical protein